MICWITMVKFPDLVATTEHSSSCPQTRHWFRRASRRMAWSTADDDDDWESNIVRNTEQAALLMADESGQLAIEAQLVSTDPKMAEAIGGIVNGLIALQAFNSELGPELQSTDTKHTSRSAGEHPVNQHGDRS